MRFLFIGFLCLGNLWSAQLAVAEYGSGGDRSATTSASEIRRPVDPGTNTSARAAEMLKRSLELEQEAQYVHELNLGKAAAFSAEALHLARSVLRSHVSTNEQREQAKKLVKALRRPAFEHERTIRAAIDEGHIIVGMNEEEADQARGRPHRIDDIDDRTTQWVYFTHLELLDTPGPKYDRLKHFPAEYFLFEDGYVTSHSGHSY